MAIELLKSLRCWRGGAFRVLAVALGLGLILALEILLRLLGVGKIDDISDPFVGFRETVPLFELNRETNEYQIAKSRQRFFQPDSFAAKKPANEFRIFCLGGSTVQGRPYAIQTSFTTWLELHLKAADSSKAWQVINSGGVSYASYRLLPIMKEVLKYKPDMFIVYTGHNEFLEDRSYSNIKHQPDWLGDLQCRLMYSRIYGTLWKMKSENGSKQTPRTNLPAEVDTLLDYEGGLAKYHRDDAWRDDVISHYRYNLLSMVQIARAAGVRLVFANPVSNIRDTPPFKVELSKSLTWREAVEFEGRWKAAKEASWDDLHQKSKSVRAVLSLDDRHAEALFLLAKVYDAMKDPRSAKPTYLRAKDEDICPLRMIEPMHEILRNVAKQTRTQFVDVRSHFETHAADGMIGDGQLIDHVHPRIEQHQEIAALLFNAIQSDGLVEVEPDWESRLHKKYSENYASLPDNYFPESVERLRGLQRWTEGRVSRLNMVD